MLLIIDNQSNFIKQFKRSFLAEQDFDYVFFDHNQPLALPDWGKVKGVILSGGKGNPYEPLNLTTDFVVLMNFNVPILGLCLGHEIIAAAYGGRIKRLPRAQNKRQRIHITRHEDPIFEGLNGKDVMLREKHSFHVSQLPDCFDVLAWSDVCPFEVIKHKERPLYGFQSHPEVSGTPGIHIMRNFIKMCGLE